jgi:hypothetical protein
MVDKARKSTSLSRQVVDFVLQISNFLKGVLLIIARNQIRALELHSYWRIVSVLCYFYMTEFVTVAQP